MARRKRTRGQRGVRPPANVWGVSSTVQSATAQEAKVKKQSAECRQPKTEGIQPRKRHVSRANHQRHKVVGKAEQNGHGHEKNHCRAMHGEHAVEHMAEPRLPSFEWL